MELRRPRPFQGNVCVAYHLSKGSWRITFHSHRLLRQFLAAGLRQLVCLIRRTHRTTVPSMWPVLLKRYQPKCNKPWGFRTNRTCDRTLNASLSTDDVIKWKHFPHSLAFVRGVHRFPSQRQVTRSLDVFLPWCFVRLIKWLSKQSWRRWFEMSSRSLWHHCNG